MDSRENRQPQNISMVSNGATANYSYPTQVTINPAVDSSANQSPPPLTRPLIRREIIKAAIMGGLAISALVYSSRHLNDCPIESGVPLYLFVGGIAGTVSAFLPLLLLVPPIRYNKIIFRTISIARAVVGLFMLSWLIVGTYWIFHINPSFDPTSGNKFCDQNVYNGAKSTACISWAIFGIIFLLIGKKIYMHLKKRKQNVEAEKGAVA